MDIKEINFNNNFMKYAMYAVAIFLVTLPFLFVQYVPATDLPQHLAQVRLLFDVQANPQQTQYEIQWIGANLLVYWIVLVNWLLFPPILAGKVTMLVLALLWVISIIALAKHINKSPIIVLVTTLFVFNPSLSWGFINFLVGFPLFILWYITVVDTIDQTLTIKKGIYIAVLSSLLFYAHALWFAVAAIVFGIVGLTNRIGIKKLLINSIPLLPAVIVAAIWYPRLSSVRTVLGFDTAPHWFASPLTRINPGWIITAVFGGLKGPIEWIVFLSIILWIALAIYTNKNGLWNLVNKNLFTVSIVLLAIVYFAPDKYMNTIYFASRWYPVALVFLLFSLPLPRFPQVYLFIAAIFFIVTFSLTTTMLWNHFEKNEQTGLTEALQNIPEKVRVLGLDFSKESYYLSGRPFIQTFAYAQVLKGCSLNFSFAQHNSGIVVQRSVDTIRLPWTPGLEWFAEFVKHEDFNQFDYVMVNAPENFHAFFNAYAKLIPVTKHGKWRLYKCAGNTSAKGLVFAEYFQRQINNK